MSGNSSSPLRLAPKNSSSCSQERLQLPHRPPHFNCHWGDIDIYIYIESKSCLIWTMTKHKTPDQWMLNHWFLLFVPVVSKAKPQWEHRRAKEARQLSYATLLCSSAWTQVTNHSRQRWRSKLPPKFIWSWCWFWEDLWNWIVNESTGPEWMNCLWINSKVSCHNSSPRYMTTSDGSEMMSWKDWTKHLCPITSLK